MPFIKVSSTEWEVGEGSEWVACCLFWQMVKTKNVKDSKLSKSSAIFMCRIVHGWSSVMIMEMLHYGLLIMMITWSFCGLKWEPSQSNSESEEREGWSEALLPLRWFPFIWLIPRILFLLSLLWSEQEPWIQWKDTETDHDNKRARMEQQIKSHPDPVVVASPGPDPPEHLSSWSVPELKRYCNRCPNDEITMIMSLGCVHSLRFY